VTARMYYDNDADLSLIQSRKVGIIGFCSGGRHAFLVSCKASEFDALVDCWGGNVIVDDPKLLNAKRPVAPIEFAANINCPILGLFGEDDGNPNPADVAKIDAELTRLGKPHEFHSYAGAGHAFMNEGRPSHRPEAASDAWQKCVAWFERYLK